MEVISVNVVANGSSNDHSTRLYNIGEGFRGVIGKVTCGIADCLYLGVMAERKYVVTVEGDLVISTETTDGLQTKTDGVYGFDIDWSQTAKANGAGKGRIIVTNPDVPSEVSTFEVVAGEWPSVRVVFPFGAGDYASVNMGDADVSVIDPAVKKLLSAKADDNPYTVGMAFAEAIMAELKSDIRFLSNIQYVYGDGRFPSWAKRLIEKEEPVTHTKLSRVDKQPGFVDPRDPLVGTPNPSDPSARVNDELFIAGDFNDQGAEELGKRLLDVLSHEPPDRDQRLVGRRNLSPYGNLDLVFVAPSNSGAEHESMGDSLAVLAAVLGSDRVDHPSFARPGRPAFTIIEGANFGPGDLDRLFGHPAGYQRPEDFCAHAGSAECALVDALMTGRPIEIKPDQRDFDQLARTRANDLARIEAAVAAANALGIDTSNIASKRDAALAKLVVFSDRFESGGQQVVTAAEASVIHEVFGELWSVHSDLDTLVSHWHHYKQHEANHDAWEARLADRKRNFKVAEGAEDNRIAQMYIGYAANPADTLAESKTAFVELFLAIQRGDLGAAHKADTKARQFSTRERMLDALIRRGKLVAVEDNSSVA